MQIGVCFIVGLLLRQVHTYLPRYLLHAQQGLRGCHSRGEAVHHSESLLLMQTMYKEGCLSKPAKESLVLFSEVSSIGSFSSRTERGMLRDLESESI